MAELCRMRSQPAGPRKSFKLAGNSAGRSARSCLSAPYVGRERREASARTRVSVGLPCFLDSWFPALTDNHPFSARYFRTDGAAALFAWDD
jgi:hypothetical protein